MAVACHGPCHLDGRKEPVRPALQRHCHRAEQLPWPLCVVGNVSLRATSNPCLLSGPCHPEGQNEPTLSPLSLMPRIMAKPASTQLRSPMGLSPM